MGCRYLNVQGKCYVWFVIFMGICFSAGSFCPVFGADPTVVRVGYYDNPPKLFRGVQGEPRGIFPEILEEIAERENWNIEWVPGVWKEGLARLESGTIDVMPDVAYSLERAEKYEFSDEPVFINWGVLYARAGLNIGSMPDIAGKRVAVMRGSIHTDGKEGIRNQAKKYNISCEFVAFDSYSGVFDALQNNLADVGVVNRLFGLTSQDLYDVLPTTVVFNPRHLKFAFPTHGSNTLHLKQKIDKHLRSANLDTDSKIKRIVQNYLTCQPMATAGDKKKVYLTSKEQAWIDAHPVVKIGIDPEFAPFEFFNKKGVFAGFSSDYIQLLNQRLGLNMEVVTGLSWTQVMTKARHGEIDVLTAVGYSKKRSQHLSYTVPYIGFYRMIFSRSDVPFIADKKDLKRLNVAVQAQTSHAEWIKENTLLKPQYYKTLQETIQAVSKGKADAFIGNLAATSYWIRKLNVTNLRIDAPVSLERQLLHMAVRKDWPELVRILNKGLASISPEEVETIRSRWIAAGYHLGVSTKAVWKWIGIVVLVSFSALFMMWYWNRRLGNEVKRRIIAENQVARTNEKLADKIAYRTRELEESRNYLQSIFNAPNEAIFIHDSKTGAIVDANDAVLNMYGFDFKDVLDMKVEDFSANKPPYTKKEADQKIALAAKGLPQTFEWHSRKKNGDLFWAEVGLKLTNSGEHVIAVIRDIDEKKRGVEVLAAEQERLAVTLRSIGDGVITTDVDGEIMLLNKVAEQITGWSHEEARGRPLCDVFHVINEKTGTRCQDLVQRVLAFGQIISLPHDAALISKDGVRKSIADSGAPIRDMDSRIIGVVLVFRDTTREKRTEEALSKIKKLESLGILAGGIAHDFNNVLTAILGNIEVASKKIGKDHQGYKLLAESRKAAVRAEKLTKQLLTFAKGGDPVKKTASLSRLIQESADFVLHGSGVSIKFDIPDDLWFVEVDTGQMSQVIQNIVINARQAMPDGGIIKIDCRNIQDAAEESRLSMYTGKFVKIAITDNGTGIPENIIDNIFDPYTTTREQGSGLGLAICHSIIDKHDGHMMVRSTPGKGSVFTIYLPVSPGDRPMAQPGKLPSAPVRSARVMVMEDEEMLRRVAQLQLEYLGHDVILASDGEEAVTRYKERMGTRGSIDVIIMDLTITGGKSGRETIGEILNLDPDAKVIVASGYSNDSVMANYKDYGFSTSLSKPFDMNALREAIVTVLS